jgi:MYXO-CTERM domain-containing protein
LTRLLRALAAVALLSGGDALAFVRSTTTPGHPESGLCLWWGTRQIAYAVNASAVTTPGCRDSSAAAALVAASFSAWSAATREGEAQRCTDLSLVGCGETARAAVGNDGVNLVVIRKGLCSDAPGFATCIQSRSWDACAAQFNCWQYGVAGGGISTLALTRTTYDVGTGEILDADVELHAWSSGATGAWFTCASPADPSCTNPPYGLGPSCTWIDLGSIVTHEAGHFLGLDHTCQYAPPYDACGSVMDPQIDVGLTSGRVLTADDVSGVCTIYPAGGATATCGGIVPAVRAGGSCEPPAEPKGGCGCSTDGAAAFAGLLGAALAAWRARRARPG